MALKRKILLLLEVLLRSHKSYWILGYGKFIGNGSNILAEAWALYIGLHVALDINIRKLEIEIDCQELFDLINGPEPDTHPLATLIAYACTFFTSLRILE